MYRKNDSRDEWGSPKRSEIRGRKTLFGGDGKPAPGARVLTPPQAPLKRRLGAPGNRSKSDWLILGRPDSYGGNEANTSRGAKNCMPIALMGSDLEKKGFGV